MATNLPDFKELAAKLSDELNAASSLTALDSLKTKYLGKVGIITELLGLLKTAPLEHKKQLGAEINLLKNQFNTLLDECKQAILEHELNSKLANETLDVTLPGIGREFGSLHPITLTQNRIIEFFKQLGFSIGDGPEIESDYYNFQALNIPEHHPARAMQDTFYTKNTKHVLRTHTSPLQVRFVEEHLKNKHPLPIKVIAPGRVYRIDMDKTHSPMFHQLEGLWIDKGISFANLKWVMQNFLEYFFAGKRAIRFRNSFFPFTEPSAEVDIMDEHGNWLEVAGCGMVHPQVLTNMGLDASIYSGLAFGLGIDRFTMLRYKINDLRLLFDNDLDFLTQFRSGVVS